MTHAWCSDPARDAAVRAAEDGRTGPLPTLGEAIAAPFACTACGGFGSDILADWLAESPVGERMGRRHDAECHRRHLECLVMRLAEEIARLSEERRWLDRQPVPPGPEGE
jgi:hypothetical protein